jgi:hypothetical protein
MTLKIKRVAGEREIQICLSGQLRSEHLSQVKLEVERAGQPIAFDLEEVDLVDVHAVRFLNECESAGIPVLRCSPYIREWMLRERSQTEPPPECK